MADVIRKATNRFTKGLVMDFSPENTKNELLTHALNATLLTFNGNELSLQNDMGNARVETAYLPEGYVPIGTCEYGGIIYIVSYNPLEDKSLIGCFPSPERNISRDELGLNENVSIENDYFLGANGTINHNTKYVLLKNNNLNPGDKFVIYADNIKNLKLADLYYNNKPIKDPILALNIVSIEDNGKIVYLNSSVRLYNFNNYTYHILESKRSNTTINKDIDLYRNVLLSGYNVFKSKTSGKLAILAELLMIDSYSVSHRLEPKKNANGDIIEGSFDIVIHPEVTPIITEENQETVPKLSYYYLENSLGYFLKCDYNNIVNVNLFDSTGNKLAHSLTLSDLYEPIDKSIGESLSTSLINNDFNFPKSHTYQTDIKTNLEYKDIILGNILLPDVVVQNGLDLPFKYDYTIVPCMSYGRLDHLAVSNTVDFSKLHAFNLSNFTTWKYRIDDNLLRLTFGADIYDTYEDDKVDGLILEFYDCQGFAGSLEITDKKSYSGIFTKILPLNSLNTLSKKKIYNENGSLVQKEIYSRNINMPLNADNRDEDTGWSEDALKEGLKDDSLEIYNDCGTLYSNILYGVKTFLRRTKKINNELKLEFILKKDFFLYTLPIYNDYYFTVNDFSNLTYPELNFILTYKLKDSSSKQAFTNDIINGGYNELDKASIDSYLGGFYKEKSLDITKYYKYKGTTDLYLEIGLELSYENLNISYDPSINSLFGCTLKLISDNDVNTPLTVSSDMEGLTGHSTILNYKDLINSDVNVLNFENADGNLHQKTIKSLSNHMFINTLESVVYEPIKINYELVVGYNASVTDITDTQVQATTVCALCHKQQDTELYNYEDFGVYESDGKFLSSVMFYNEGTSKEEIFGICRLIKTLGTITELCLKGPNVVTEAQKITTAGKLNTGEPLKQLINNIGKLTFCQPHVHGLSDQINGVNVYYKMTNTLDKNTLILYPEYGGDKIGNHYEDNYGTYATSNLFNNPKYNLVVNTKNSINYNSEFMSTTDFKETTSRFYKFDSTGGAGGGYTDGEIKVREFTGLTGEQLEVFNRKLVETFKNVYAYNPDYDSLTVNKGNVSLQNYNPNFSTNIISTDSVINYLGETTLNDYIYLGPVKFSDYLNKLANRSNIQVSNDDGFMPQVQLTENLLYCGVKGSNYLISSLTYNTPVPFEIEQELEFSASNLTVIKHLDGTNSFMEGTPNKKALYGFISKYNKMIELDVSNYEIDADGKLSVIDEGTKEPISGNKELNITSSILLQNYYFDYSFKNSKDELSSLKLALYLSVNGYNSSELLGFSQFLDEIIFASKITPDYGYWLDGGLTINPSFRVISSDNKYSYEIEPTKLNFEFKFVELNDRLSLYPWSYDKPSLYNQSLDTIKTLLSRLGSITLENSNSSSDYVQNYLANSSGLEESLIINGQYYSSYGNFNDASVKLLLKRVDIKCNKRQESNYLYIILLISFKFNELEFIINQKSKLETIEENFVKVVKTKKYTDDSISHKYTVHTDYNKARIRGTSITLNDLEYINNKDGHRLFVKNGLHNYDSYARNKIYYRKLEDGQDSYYEDTKYLNNIFLYTGPCFTTDNLN